MDPNVDFKKRLYRCELETKITSNLNGFACKTTNLFTEVRPMIFLIQ